MMLTKSDQDKLQFLLKKEENRTKKLTAARNDENAIILSVLKELPTTKFTEKEIKEFISEFLESNLNKNLYHKDIGSDELYSRIINIPFLQDLNPTYHIY